MTAPAASVRRPMDDRTRVLLADVEAQTLKMRQHWAGMDDAARLAAVNELNCRSQELYATVNNDQPAAAGGATS